MAKGSCLCSSVKFEVAGALGPAEVCHCVQCRKWTGHFFANVEVPRVNVTIHGSENLCWYQSSKKVQRGFCSKCGSPLFFDPIDKSKHEWIGIAMGAFEAPTETKILLHIFVAEKGDYYEILDGAPQNQY